MIDLNVRKFFLKKFKLTFIKTIKLIFKIKKYALKITVIYTFKLIDKIFYSKLIQIIIPIHLKIKIKSRLSLHPKLYNILKLLRLHLKNPKALDKIFYSNFFLTFFIIRIYIPILKLMLNRITCKSTLLTKLKDRPHLLTEFQRLISNKNNILCQNIISPLSSLEIKYELSPTIKEIYTNLKKEIIPCQNNNNKL